MPDPPLYYLNCCNCYQYPMDYSLYRKLLLNHLFNVYSLRGWEVYFNVECIGVSKRRRKLDLVLRGPHRNELIGVKLFLSSSKAESFLLTSIVDYLSVKDLTGVYIALPQGECEYLKPLAEKLGDNKKLSGVLVKVICIKDNGRVCTLMETRFSRHTRDGRLVLVRDNLWFKHVVASYLAEYGYCVYFDVMVPRGLEYAETLIMPRREYSTVSIDIVAVKNKDEEEGSSRREVLGVIPLYIDGDEIEEPLPINQLRGLVEDALSSKIFSKIYVAVNTGSVVNELLESLHGLAGMLVITRGKALQIDNDVEVIDPVEPVICVEGDDPMLLEVYDYRRLYGYNYEVMILNPNASTDEKMRWIKKSLRITAQNPLVYVENNG